MSYMTLMEQIDKLENELLDARIDLNVKDLRIQQLEKDLAAARDEVRELQIGTQTMRRLQILGDSDDDNGFDPRRSGVYRKNTWEKVR